MPDHPQLSRSRRPGFTLIELLVVISIGAVLLVLSVGSLQNMIRSTDLSASAATVINTLNLARQTALSSNHPVEVRFYKVSPQKTTGTLAYRALGIYEINESGQRLIQKLDYLTGATELASTETHGTLLFYTPTASAALTASGTCDYRYFRFLPDGSTNLNTQPDTGADTWHVMLYATNAPPSELKLPANYISIQLDPVSGRTKSFQPGM
ncbi:MAG: Verru_Chthon cassette protein D [Chthoniobacteraceae bacterium]